MKALPQPSGPNNLDVKQDRPSPSANFRSDTTTTSPQKNPRLQSDNRQPPHQPQHQPSKSKSGGFFSFASAALDKTSSAIANISEPVNRPHTLVSVPAGANHEI